MSAETSLATDPKIIVALIAACASLVLAVVNLIAGQRNQRALETLKSNLRDAESEKDAQLEYEYEARKKLYTECGPLMFQLSEAAERAIGRIKGFAQSASEGNLDPENSWLGGARHGYYWASSYYRLILPLSIGKLLQKRLTHLDLSLDRKIRSQYSLIRSIGDSFTDDFEFAQARHGGTGIGPDDVLEYDPHASTETNRATHPTVFIQQGIPRGILENAAASLIVRDPGGQERILEYSEFEKLLFDTAGSDTKQAFERIGYLLRDFTPHGRPVLWRILCAQLYLYRALLLIRGSEPPFLGLEHQLNDNSLRTALDWRKTTQTDTIPETEIAQPLNIGLAYAQDRIRTIQRQITTA